VTIHVVSYLERVLLYNAYRKKCYTSDILSTVVIFEDLQLPSICRAGSFMCACQVSFHQVEIVMNHLQG
jgi:hypothetical protein